MDQQLSQCLAQQEEVITLESVLLIFPLDPQIDPQIPKWVQEATKELQERAVEIERKMDAGLAAEPLKAPFHLRLLRACINPEVIDLIQSFDLTVAITELDQLMITIRSRITAAQWLVKADKWYALTRHAYEQRTTCILHLFANSGKVTWSEPQSLRFLREMVDRIEIIARHQDESIHMLCGFPRFIQFLPTYPEIILMMLDDSDIPIDRRLLSNVCCYDYQNELIDFLLKDPRTTIFNDLIPGIEVMPPLMCAINYKKPYIIERLLADPRIEINYEVTLKFFNVFFSRVFVLDDAIKLISLMMDDPRARKWINTASESQIATLKEKLKSIDLYEKFGALLSRDAPQDAPQDAPP